MRATTPRPGSACDPRPVPCLHARPGPTGHQSRTSTPYTRHPLLCCYPHPRRETESAGDRDYGTCAWAGGCAALCSARKPITISSSVARVSCRVCTRRPSAVPGPRLTPLAPHCAHPRAPAAAPPAPRPGSGGGGAGKILSLARARDISHVHIVRNHATRVPVARVCAPTARGARPRGVTAVTHAVS